jgi:signal-transduction protein with cAMP-binding, CBS, and nucleotidyltransferase domain
LRRRAAAAGGLDARLSVLSSVPELGDCSDSQLRTLLQYVDEVSVQPGVHVSTDGKPCSQLLIVAGGQLRSESQDGRRRTLTAGDTLGWTAMWERGQNEGTVVADTPARLLAVSHAQFRAFQAVTDPPATDSRANAPAPGLTRQAS